MLAVRARALLDGRLAPSIDDVLALAEPILKHRMALTFAARADGETIDGVIGRLEVADRMSCMASSRRAPTGTRPPAAQRASGEGRSLAATMPRLILEARRVAATVIHGLHGRRRAGPGENFWQYRRFVSGEAGRARRLAPLGARRSSLCARAGMGGRAHGLDLARPFAVDGVSRRRSPQDTKLDRTLVVAFALAEVLVEGGERVGIPGLMRPTGSRNVHRQDGAGASCTTRPSAPACRRRSRRRRSPRSCVLSDLWSPIADVRTHHRAAVRRAARTAMSCRSSIRPKRPSRIRAASSSSSRKAAAPITAGRAETWRADYQARVARHRAEIRAETDRLGWSFAIHRTDRPASELLLALHARIGAGRDGTGINRRHAVAAAGRPA